VVIFYAFNPQITFIPKRIGVNFPQLKTLLITKSSLKYIEWRDFKYLNHLHTLSLHDNKISHVSQCAFQYLESLVRVILDGNHLVALSESLFENLPNLEYFSVSFNNITQLKADLFANNPQLKEVVVRNNYLNRIEVNFQTMKGIEYIDFSGNECFKGSYVCCNGTYFKMFLTNISKDCGGPELC
jgi:Leucine-rich repeat (LRR) protein